MYLAVKYTSNTIAKLHTYITQKALAKLLVQPKLSAWAKIAQCTTSDAFTVRFNLHEAVYSASPLCTDNALVLSSQVHFKHNSIVPHIHHTASVCKAPGTTQVIELGKACTKHYTTSDAVTVRFNLHETVYSANPLCTDNALVLSGQIYFKHNSKITHIHHTASACKAPGTAQVIGLGKACTKHHTTSDAFTVRLNLHETVYLASPLRTDIALALSGQVHFKHNSKVTHIHHTASACKTPGTAEVIGLGKAYTKHVLQQSQKDCTTSDALTFGFNFHEAVYSIQRPWPRRRPLNSSNKRAKSNVNH